MAILVEKQEAKLICRKANPGRVAQIAILDNGKYPGAAKNLKDEEVSQ
jgi:hypothetical protein